MIFTDRTITIRNSKSTINEPVILYRGDFEVSIRFTIMESKFRFKSGVNLVDSEKASHGQLAILTPYGGNVFSEIVKCEDGTVTFTLTKEMIDQLEEVGLYSFQIRLFDYYRESRVSIPPVEFGIEVREPVASEDHDNEVNNAIVGYSIAKVVDGLTEDVPDTFDDEGQYNKTEWETGDRISEGRLNKIEDAIDKINQNEKADAEVLGKRATNNFNVLNNSINSNFNILNNSINMLNNTKADVGGKITIHQLDTNAGKIKQEHLDSTLIRQMAGDTAVNTVPADDSITSNMLTSGCITVSKLRSLGYIIKYDTSRVKVDKVYMEDQFANELTVSFDGTIWIYRETGSILKTIRSTGGIDMTYEMPNWSILVGDLSTGAVRVLNEGQDIGGPCVILGINNNGHFSNGLLVDIRNELLNRNGTPHQTLISGTGNKQRVNKVIGVSNVVDDKLIIEMRGPAWITLPNGDYLSILSNGIQANRGESFIRLALPDNMQFVAGYRIQIELQSTYMLVYNYGKGTIRVQYDTQLYNRDADDVILLSQYRNRITGGALASDISLDTESPFIEYKVRSGFEPLDIINFEAVNGYGYGKSALVTVDGSAGSIWYYCSDGTKIWYDSDAGRGFLYAETFDGAITDGNIYTVEVPHNHCLVYGTGAVRVLPIDSAINSGMKILAACHEGRIKSGILFDILMHIKEIHDGKKQTVPAYYKEHLTTKINAIKNKHMTYGMAVTSFAFITDMHWTTNTKVSPILLREVCSECNINHIFNGGDWVNNTSSTDAVISQLEEIQTMFANNNILDKTMMVLGNHDDNSIYKNASKTVLQEQMFDLVFRRISSDSNIVMDSDAEAIGYYYKDDNFNRIRYIVLNCIDTVYQIDNATDTITYGGQHSYEFRKRQTDWFCNEALNVPNDKWNVVVCSHIPPVTTNILGSDKAPNYGQHLINILNAFKYKTSYTATASGGTFGDYSIDVDFTDKGGNVIAWLAGHVHCDNIVQNNDINIVTTLNNDTTVWDYAPTKTTGTHTEQAFDVFTVNTKTRTVHITRIGAGSDRSFTY